MEGREMMHKCEMEQKRWKAVYTIETAILMGILLPALAGILWICILLYEKGVLQGTISQNVLLENMKEDKRAEPERIISKENSLGKAKLYFKITKIDQKVIAEGEGYASVPGIVSLFFPDRTLAWKAYGENSWADTSKRLREIFQKKTVQKSGDTK